jgi:Ca2+-binding RTX toxin-like protein
MSGIINGTDGDDILNGTTTQTLINGGGGNDIIRGRGYDTLKGGDGNDHITAGWGNNWLIGNAGNDTLIGGDEADYLIGGPGADSMVGGSGSDSFWYNYGDGLISDDTIVGGAGFDHLVASTGSLNQTVIMTDAMSIEHVQTDKGNDLLDASAMSTAVYLSGNAGNDTLIGGRGADHIDVEGGADTLIGNAGDDMFDVGGPGATLTDDVLRGGDGYDTVFFATGDENHFVMTDAMSIEQVWGDQSNDLLDGRALSLGVELLGNEGNDTLYGGAGGDVIHGGEGDDLLVGGAGHNVLDGGNGDDNFWFDQRFFGFGDYNTDTLDGGDGYDSIRLFAPESTNFRVTDANHIERVFGSFVNDFLDAQSMTHEIAMYGGDGHDVLLGGSGDDYLVGENGDDVINGGAGGDMLFGSAGNDNLHGTGDGDQLHGDNGDDVFAYTGQDSVGADGIDGGAGFDTISLQTWDRAHNVTLTDAMGVERIEGGNMADVLSAASVSFHVELLGGDGADVLTGGSAGDMLDGGAGTNVLTGGAGADLFTMWVWDHGANTVTDFAVGTDRVEIVSAREPGTAPLDFAHLHMTQEGADTRIVVDDADGGASILLVGVQMATLTADSFTFSAPPPFPF